MEWVAGKGMNVYVETIVFYEQPELRRQHVHFDKHSF